MDAEYDSALFTKLCAFQFFNTFNGLFWVAFIRQDLEQLEAHVLLLTASLVIIGNLQELAGPVFLSHFRRIQQLAVGTRMLMKKTGSRVGIFEGYKLVHTQAFRKGGVAGRSLAEVNHQLASIHEFSMVEERIELATLFGSIVMFSSSLPTLPFIVLACTVAEIHLDAFKLVQLQRFAGVRAIVGIGMTHHAAALLSYCGLFVNILVMLVTRRTGDGPDHGKTTMDVLFPRSTGREQVLIALLMENICLALMMLVSNGINKESSVVQQEQYRQKYFENRAFACQEADGPVQGYTLRKRQVSRVMQSGTLTEKPQQENDELCLEMGTEPDIEHQDHKVDPTEAEEAEQLPPVLE